MGPIKTMNKRPLQTVLLVTVLGYTMLLAYQTMTANQSAANLKSFVVSRGEEQEIPRAIEMIAEIPSSAAMITTKSPPPSAGVAGASSALQLDDIYITVKTTYKFHESRLSIILKTWFQLAKEQTWFFTDIDDPYLSNLTNNHMINTKCPPTHQRDHLGCKTSAEFDYYLKSGKKWWCHFDDDNYVNVPNLVNLLRNYDPIKDWYLGKLSIRRPLIRSYMRNGLKENVSFWFGTGGAGYCISKALSLKMISMAGFGKFKRMVKKTSTDDVTMGYIIEHLLKTPLTVVDQFHSHLEPLYYIRNNTFKQQVSLSYSESLFNTINIEGFSTIEDPTRFLSLHCLLFPHFDFCAKVRKVFLKNAWPKTNEDDYAAATKTANPSSS